MPNSEDAYLSSGRVVFEFRKTEQDPRHGLLVLNRQDFAELSVFDAKALPRAIKARLLTSWGSDNLARDWNIIADRIYDIAHAIFEIALQRPFTFNGWAQVDKGYLAASSPAFGDDHIPEMRAQFPSSELQLLLAVSPATRGHMIASICEAYVEKSANQRKSTES